MTADDPSGPIPFRLLPDTAELTDRGHLRIGGCSLVELAAEFGTPLFVYDESHLRARCRAAVAAFDGCAAYAAKAFLCAAMARLAISEGIDIDVASGGELATVLRAFEDAGASGGDVARRVVMHGNNKSVGELAMARAAGVGRIVVDSFAELDRLEELHRADGSVPRVLLRVTPDVRAETHEYISTGQADSKFGFGVGQGAAAEGAAGLAVKRAAAMSSVELVGIHCHVGSQVFRVASLTRALDAVAAFAGAMFGGTGFGGTGSGGAGPAAGPLRELSVGGGLGVAYVESEQAPTIAEWGQALTSRWAVLAEEHGLDARLVAEPGRAIAATAAVTIYTVGAVKEVPGVRTYVAVDGGYGDNPRPMLYGSDYTAFMPARADEPRPQRVRLVGKHCESGDVIVRSAPVPAGLAAGDLVATPVTGAYGYSMGAPYNRIGRPAVVFVAGGDARLVIRRETIDDLLALDVR
ncbi:diaminopimelate decarboxylase [Candidatus Poriferisodalis sp.]|uniref:diaminopimelate decarboxylase n=1 Tax=Candidatus Poriferisodalis sp. TaxID=3101277 RepID=UPI003B02CCB4